MAKVIQLVTARPGWRAVFGPEEEARSLPVVLWALFETEGGRQLTRGLVLWGGVESPLRDAEGMDSFRGYTAPGGEGPEWREGFVREVDPEDEATLRRLRKRPADPVGEGGIPY